TSSQLCSTFCGFALKVFISIHQKAHCHEQGAVSGIIFKEREYYRSDREYSSIYPTENTKILIKRCSGGFVACGQAPTVGAAPPGFRQICHWPDRVRLSSPGALLRHFLRAPPARSADDYPEQQRHLPADPASAGTYHRCSA